MADDFLYNGKRLPYPKYSNTEVSNVEDNKKIRPVDWNELNTAVAEIINAISVGAQYYAFKRNAAKPTPAAATDILWADASGNIFSDDTLVGGQGVELNAAVSQDVYVDSVNGSDDNDGKTTGTALLTIQAVRKKFPASYTNGAKIRINLAGVGGFGSSATAPAT